MNSFEDLVKHLPLPQGWAEPKTVFHQFEKKDFKIKLAAVTSEGPGGVGVFGAAADPVESPLSRAYFELVERISVVMAEESAGPVLGAFDLQGHLIDKVSKDLVFPMSDAPEIWRYAKSNGVAAGQSFFDACRGASLELLERDQILRSWYGEFAPEPLELGNLLPDVLKEDYWLEAYRFRHPSLEVSSPSVVGVFGFPIDIKNPLVFSFGAGATVNDALVHARKEFYQRLGFLWGEPIPSSEPPFEPSAFYHQEFYLNPAKVEKIRSWLGGQSWKSYSMPPISQIPKVSFVDLTPECLKGKISVVKARSNDFLSLTFGRKNPQIEKCWGAPIPGDILIHPIA